MQKTHKPASAGVQPRMRWKGMPRADGHDRWIRSWSPGHPGILFGISLACVLAISFLGDSLFDEAAAREYRDAQARGLLAAEHERRGWRAVSSEAGLVEFLSASRAFEIPLYHGALRGAAPSDASVRRVRAAVEKALQRYSPEVLSRIGLRRVVLCAHLTEGAQPIPSLPNFEESLLLDVSARDEFLERLIHHEVFHFVDFRDDGVVARDDGWEALNPPGFRYGAGGRAVRDRDASSWTEDHEGVLSFYSLSALEEDKAELFSFAVVAPEAVVRRARVDRVLSNKLAALRRQLDQNFPRSQTAFFEF